MGLGWSDSHTISSSLEVSNSQGVSSQVKSVDEKNRSIVVRSSLAGKACLSGLDECVTTVGELLHFCVEEFPKNKAIAKRHMEHDGESFSPFQFLTFSSLTTRLKKMAISFQKHLKVIPNECIVLVGDGPSRLELVMTCMAMGYPVILVNDSTDLDEISHIILETSAAVVITSRAIGNRLMDEDHRRTKCASVKGMILMDGIPSKTTVELGRQMDVNVLSCQRFVDSVSVSETEIREFSFLNRGVDGADVAFVVNRVGISHTNLISAVCGFMVAMVLDVKEDDVCLSGLLPVDAPEQLVVELATLYAGGCLGFCSRGRHHAKGVREDMRLLEPSMVVGSLDVFAMIVNWITEHAKSKGSRFMGLLAEGLQEKRSAQLIGEKTVVWDTFVFDEVQKIVGGRIRTLVNCGKSVPQAWRQFVSTSMDCGFVQMYGPLEACGVALMEREDRLFYLVGGEGGNGHTSEVVPCCEIHLLDHADLGLESKVSGGRICIRGFNVVGCGAQTENQEMVEDEQIQNAIQDQRLFVTDDLAVWNPDGSLHWIGNVSDVVRRTDTDELLSLHDIAVNLSASELIKEVVAVDVENREGRRTKMSVTVTVEEEAVKEYVKVKEVVEEKVEVKEEEDEEEEDEEEDEDEEEEEYEEESDLEMVIRKELNAIARGCGMPKISFVDVIE